MRQSHDAMHQLFRGELVKIESKMKQERESMLEFNSSEASQLADRRNQLEEEYMNTRQSTADEYQNELEELRRQNDDELNRATRELQTCVQTLKQQMQGMRAAYQLNTQKLIYNFQILDKRREENTHTLKEQKRTQSQHRDALRRLQKRYVH